MMTSLALPTSLDLFERKPINTAVEQSQYVEIKPTTTLENSTVEFYYPGISGTYVDLSETLLRVKERVVKSDGTNLDANSFVSTCNGFLHSLFNRVEVSLNDCLISNGINYPFKAYLQTLLNYGDQVKNGYLRTEMYFAEGDADISVSKLNATSGLSKRKEAIALSRQVELIGRLHTNFFHQEKYLLDMVNIRMTLHKSDNSFCIISDIQNANFKVLFDHASLFLKTVKVSPSIRLAHSTVLSMGRPAIFQYTDTETKTLVIPSGLNSFSKANLFPARVPNRLTIALCPTAAFHGTYNTNPFKFKHFNCNYLAFTLNGNLIPSPPFDPDFKTKHYLRNYLSVFLASGIYGENKQTFVSLDSYKAGYFLTSQDFSPDWSTRNELPVTGDVSIELRFSEATTEAITLILFAEHTSELTVDQNRVVTIYPIQ